MFYEIELLKYLKLQTVGLLKVGMFYLVTLILTSHFRDRGEDKKGKVLAEQ